MTRLIIPRKNIAHLTYSGYAVVFLEGYPNQKVGLWETRSQRQSSWAILGLVGMGIGLFEATEWRRLNPAHTRDLPPNYRLNPGYELYETHRWQEKDLQKQKRKLKITEVAVAAFAVSGAACFISGLVTHPQVLLGNGVVLPYSINITPSSTQLLLSFNL